MNIYVDADACPVKEIIEQEAASFGIPVTFVKSYAHYSPQNDSTTSKTIYVDTGADSVDYRIMLLAKRHDIIVTQDYGLASLALAKACIVLHHKGFVYSNTTIDQLLDSRHAQAKLRKSGKRTKGPKAFTEEDRNAFRDKFVKVLTMEAHKPQ
ncbi:YaiI/YqxD family protein [Radiobacillus kanasensis]|uniref:YaiI/YqxD family protein n=1 Tax=Radiobacillus kanasensis TaxID=2844358 RepID=UPI001E40E22C|nr:YaiI/YqxD family protein [Radiobacillus kanasensis]UFU01200.1 YaiI/YqxD family protein [Radiobacillus kanasensis]